eukprot:TRINITY_DN15205_c0_g1_i3.p1 TRINITY_DN15205_c0_g1~~TRINITY_DN15205_c0_g1_i3.p1  ORF type:complete len:371 (+),score=130.86 TRINITY_DN15205_c0_g1_i3:96-1115(+)
MLRSLVGSEMCIRDRSHATEATIKEMLVSPLDSVLMTGRSTSSVQMQRPRFLTTPSSPYHRPQIVQGTEYKWNNSVDYKSQGLHHSARNNCRPTTYTEQVAEAYSADRRRVPLDLEAGKTLKKEMTDYVHQIREPIDQKMCGLEAEMKEAQERGDTFRMNICRDLIMQLEKQYLYIKKNTMKLLVDEKLGRSERKVRMEKDWYTSWGDFREEVEQEKESLGQKHNEEMQQFKSEIFNVAKTASELQVSEQVHQMRKEVQALVQAGRIQEAKAKREEANQIALAELKGQSPLEMLRSRNLEQRMAALALKQRQEKAEFEKKVEYKAVGLATWRCGMEQVD